MTAQRRAGLIQVMVGGVLQDAKGEFEYNLGIPKRDEINGADGNHGFKETAQAAYIKGAITDRGTLDLEALVTLDDTTVTLQLGNGKTISLPHAWYAGDGTGKTSEAEIDFHFKGQRAREI